MKYKFCSAPSIERYALGDAEIKLGDKIKKEIRWIEVQEGPRGRITTKQRGEAVGTVVYIHPKGRYYTLEFTFPDGTFRESFSCSTH